MICNNALKELGTCSNTLLQPVTCSSALKEHVTCNTWLQWVTCSNNVLKEHVTCNILLVMAICNKCALKVLVIYSNSVMDKASYNKEWAHDSWKEMVICSTS